MQNYSTILGVIKCRQSGIPFSDIERIFAMLLQQIMTCFVCDRIIHLLDMLLSSRLHDAHFLSLNTADSRVR